MKNFSERKNGIFSNQFLLKFLSNRKKTEMISEKEKEKKEEEIENIKDKNINIKAPLKIIHSETDYNSIEWLDQFSKKKKDKFIQRTKESINKYKTSRNLLKNKQNNLNRLNSFSKESSVNNFQFKQSKFSFNKSVNGKKGNSTEKNKFNQIKLIKQLKEELKENPNKLDYILKNKSTEKIKNIKIEKIKSNNSKKEIRNSFHFIQHSNKQNINNSMSSKNNIMNKTNIEMNQKKKKKLYNKIKSKSNDLGNIKNIKNIKNEKKENSIRIIQKRNFYNKYYSNNNSKFLNEKNISQSQKNIIKNPKEKILLYGNIKIKIIENPRISKKKLNNYTMTEPIDLIRANNFKSSEIRANSESNIPLKIGTSSSMKNKYRDLICEYESEIDS